MAGWQKAGEIPGLLIAAGSPPPMTQSGGAVMSGGYGAGALSIDFGIWDFIWRGIVLFFGLITVIPAPWALVWYIKWLVSCVRVPGRPNMSFAGNALTLVPWYFGFIVLAIIVGVVGSKALGNLLSIAQIALYWLFLRWFIANLASNAQPLGLSFSGSFWAYLGWMLLTVISFITIIGLGLGLCRASALDLPQHPGHAPAGRIQGYRTTISLAHHRRVGPELADHPDSLGLALDDALAVVANRAGGANRLRGHVSVHYPRSRTEPSCATEATSVPSGLKISPRVRPLPPCVLGESCA
jgi:hypothetical protein